VNETTAEHHRAGFVALGGRSNVGKSTLLNRIVGEKVAAVSPRPQTTRRRILGVRSDPDAQLILIDMPGIHVPRKLLNERMVSLARKCLGEADVIVGVIEAAAQLNQGDRSFMEEIRSEKQPHIIAINKIDLMPRELLIPLTEKCLTLAPDAEIVPVSALTGENIPELISTMKQALPESPSLMPEDLYTDQTERMLAEEAISERIFSSMREEVPFSTVVKVEDFSDDPDRNLLRISAIIVVEKESHKGMVIGAGGQQLKQIGQQARLQMEQLFGRHIFLELRVKVQKNWTRDPRKLQEFGL
jgi:GTP-binding protein Era